MEEVVVCPSCGATSEETIDALFSGKESAIRVHTDFYECKKCGEQWEKEVRE